MRPLLTKSVKRFFLRACECLGLFRLTARVFRGRLPILCYHGFQLQDECEFRPQLFISRASLEYRLRYLSGHGFNVLPLGEALERLRSGSLPRRALAITIDDGFKSTLSVAGPLLRKFGMTATVYVTSYYMDKQVPVFRLGVQYVFWKAQRGDIDIPERGAAGLGDIVAPELFSDPPRAMWALIRCGEAMGSEQQRVHLLVRVAQVLGVDIQPLFERHLLSIMSADEVRTLAASGMDVQLHTHRHRFPLHDRAAACREIEENRTRLHAATGVETRHFCYPSGLFDTSQWPWLASLGIASATTCLPGLNRYDTPAYGLRRFLDSESIDFVEFRAELAGFNECLRFLKRVIRPGARHVPAPTAS